MSFAPTDADMDNIYHALGRPVGPQVTPYRNYFNIDADSETAKRFEASGLWTRGKTVPGGGTYYGVNGAGVAALWKWKAEKRKAAGLRVYRVWGEEISESVVVAKSAGAAKYTLYLDLADCFPDGYRQFLSYRPRAALAEARP